MLLVKVRMKLYVFGQFKVVLKINKTYALRCRKCK